MDTTKELPPQYTNREPGPQDSWMAEMNTRAGDVKTVWNKDNVEEVNAARAQFDQLKAKGYAAYKTDRNGDKGELLREFDPNAEGIILAPQMKGG